MTGTLALLKQHGLKATAPRGAILGVLAAKHEPLSAQDIYKKLPKKTEIDLVTVYRTLASFEKAGIVKRVDLRSDAVLYELNDEHHHHIVCTSCGTVEDFDLCDIGEMAKKIAGHAKRFKTIGDHSLELFGICNACVKG